MSKHDIQNICWRKVIWRRPYEQEQVHELFQHLASTSPRGAIIWEARSSGAAVEHYIGADAKYIHKIEDAIKIHGDIRLQSTEDYTRSRIDSARQLSVSHPNLSLNTEASASAVRAGLAALVQTRNDEASVVQIVLGASFTPTTTPKNLPDPNASLLQTILGRTPEAPLETRNSIKEKNTQHCFEACIRIGVSGEQQASKLNSIVSAFRMLEASGARMGVETINPEDLNMYRVPRTFPLRLSIKELTIFTLLPFGEEALPGTSSLHPKFTMPPKWYHNPTGQADVRAFALSGEGSESGLQLNISSKDSLEHTVILGPTGSGKSTVMEHLILTDVNAGRSMLVIDPKADLIYSILARIPDERINDIVVISPSDSMPVGFNPLSLPGDPVLITDAILAVFKEIFSENWGIRSQDVLSAALLTLIQTKGSSLLWLPALLTDDIFRHRITSELDDEIVLKPFWKNYDSMRESERKQEIAPVLNKMRQFLYRPGLRSILGQSQPKFQLTDLFYGRKIVLVPLNKGLIGAESARLLGSLIVGLTWTLALSRANVAPEKRHIVSIYIDELQDYLSLPTDLSDALAQARGLGVGITMAHQYRAQLPPDIRAGVDANARNKIVFGLGAADAKDVAAMAPELEALDFMSLPRYGIYANFMANGKQTGWVRGTTFPPAPTRYVAEGLHLLSCVKYGVPAESVDADFLKLIQPTEEETPPDIDDSTFGRRKI